jgi:3-hydroxybutyryl-CoA dehydrogenase
MSLPGEVAVIGAGAMGAGIARAFADAGASVRLCARRESSLEAARPRLGEHAVRVRMTTSHDEALDAAELVVETIVEELEPKRELLVKAEELAAPGAILTTNTSSLPLAPLAAALRQPGRFAGLHWLNPPELVELVEVVGAEETAPAATDALVDWMRLLGKEPVVVRRDVPGFIVNRLQYALLREAYALWTRAFARSRTSIGRSCTGWAPAGRRSGRSRRWTSPGWTSMPPSPPISGPSSRAAASRRRRSPTCSGQARWA